MQKVKRGKIDPELRHQLYELQNKRCGYCGTKIGFSEVTVDHKIPLSRGGPDCMDNMICSCKPCNALKGNRTIEEFRGVMQQVNYNLMQQRADYRAALRFGLIREHKRKRILFYFEARGEARRRKR